MHVLAARLSKAIPGRPPAVVRESLNPLLATRFNFVQRQFGLDLGLYVISVMMWRQLRSSSQAKNQANNNTSSQKVLMWLIGAEAGNGRVEALATECSALETAHGQYHTRTGAHCYTRHWQRYDWHTAGQVRRDLCV